MTRGLLIPATVTLHVTFCVVKRGGRKEMQMPTGASQHRKPDDTLVPTARAAASNATGSWFDMAMSKAEPSMCFERVAPPTAWLCFGLPYNELTAAAAQSTLARRPPELGVRPSPAVPAPPVRRCR